MARDRPWYKRSGGDFVLGTLGFPDAEHKWAYSAVIDMLNDRDRPLADDAGFICGFTGLSRKKWAAVRRYLLDNLGSSGEPYLFLNAAGELTNPRFERERAERLGERERAVETGRLGGQKSAAMRAAGQGELGLAGDETPINGPKVGRRMPLKSADKSLKVEPASPENNDLAEGPPQPSRAREEAKSIDKTPPSSEPSPPRARAREGGGDGVLVDPQDLHATAAELARIAGVGLINPKRIADAVETVRQWRDDGIDFAETVIPAIRAETMAHPDRPIYALAYFDARIRKAHAVTLNGKANPSLARKSAGPPLVLNVQDDPDPRLASLRDKLLAQTGERLYGHWLGPKAAALQVQDGRIIVTAVSDFHAQWISANYLPLIAQLANISVARVSVQVQK